MYNTIVKMIIESGESLENTTISWFSFVENNFSSEQLNTFKYILNSFPEKLLIINNEYLNNDVISVLALIAYDIGNSRELIKNIAISKSISDLFNSIESDNQLTENNKILLALLSESLNIPYIKDLTTKEKITKLLLSKNTTLNSYNYIKNRGTINTLKKALTNYFLDANLPKITFTITNTNDGNLDILIDDSFYTNGEADYLIDFASQIGGTPGAYEYSLKRSSDLFKLLMSIKPAGIKYNTYLISDLDEIQLYLEISEIDANYDTNEYTFTISNPNDVEVAVSIIDYTDSPGAETPTVVNLATGQSAIVTRLADVGSYFSTDNNVTKIQFTVTYEMASKVYIVEHEADNPVLTALTLNIEDFVVSKGVDLYGGYINVYIKNNNNISVYASLTIDWSISSTINETFTIPANASSAVRRYRNSSSSSQDAGCSAMLTHGELASDLVEKTITGVMADNTPDDTGEVPY